MIRREVYGFRCFLQLVPLHRPFTKALSDKMTQKTPVLHPDHPMYTEAVEAMKRYHEALASGCSAGEAERLRQIAESQPHPPHQGTAPSSRNTSQADSVSPQARNQKGCGVERPPAQKAALHLENGLGALGLPYVASRVGLRAAAQHSPSQIGDLYGAKAL